MKYLTFFIVMTISLITGCSMETVPPAYKGKILSTSGYSPDLLEPGRYRLWGYDKMVLLDTSTKTFKEPVKVKLKDKLELNIDIRFRGRITNKTQNINKVLNDIQPSWESNTGSIAFTQVYTVYGKMIIRNKVREVVSQLTVDEVHKNYSAISPMIAKAIEGKFAQSPIQISDVTIGNIDYPKVVNEAINAAEERRLAIEKEQAQAQIELTRKKNERLLAEANYQIEITKAKAIRDKNKIIGEGVTPELIELKRLEVLEKMTTNNNTVFMPVEGMTSLGAQIRMFSK